MNLRPYKFVVKAIPQVVDDDGEVIGEHNGVEPVELFGATALEAWAAAFPGKLAAAEAQTAER